MAKISTGQLRERVELRSFSSASNSSYGEPVKTWSTYATVWAKVEALTTREFLAASQINAPASIKVTLRHRSDISAEHRVRIGATDYNLISPPMALEGEKVWLELLCQQIEPGT